jgi:hypothetical protein
VKVHRDFTDVVVVGVIAAVLMAIAPARHEVVATESLDELNTSSVRSPAPSGVMN